jgi:hypothetical protein
MESGTLRLPSRPHAWRTRHEPDRPQDRPGVFSGRPGLDAELAPALGDIVRLGGRQFCIEARVWEHDGVMPVLRLFVGSGRAQSDTSFGVDP